MPTEMASPYLTGWGKCKRTNKRPHDTVGYINILSKKIKFNGTGFKAERKSQSRFL